MFGIHEGAFYQLFVRLSSTTSLKPIIGKIDAPLGKYQLDSDKNWQKLELFNFKLKIFNSKMLKKFTIFTHNVIFHSTLHTLTKDYHQTKNNKVKHNRLS